MLESAAKDGIQFLILSLLVLSKPRACWLLVPADHCHVLPHNI
jgi:hypothetical protein